MAKSNGHKKVDQKTPTVAVGTLVAQPNGGSLLVGNPGNKGGTGRPATVVRERARESFYKLIPTLEAIADGTLKQKIKFGEATAEADAAFSDRISAIDKLGRYGLGAEGGTIAAAQLETPDGYTFSLVIGERASDD